MRRQYHLVDQSKQFTILMAEATLRWHPGSVDLQVQQFKQIAAVMRLPNVSIGILPLHGQARVLYSEGPRPRPTAPTTPTTPTCWSLSS
jgi:hypothetical protein